MATGITDMLGLAAALVIAVPAGLFGVELLVAGRPLGAVFLGVAALALLAERYVTTPGDVPGSAVGKLVGTVAKTPEEEEDP